MCQRFGHHGDACVPTCLQAVLRAPRPYRFGKLLTDPPNSQKRDYSHHA
jgi:hypothetical protein